LKNRRDQTQSSGTGAVV